MIDGIILSFQLFTRLPFRKDVEFSQKNLRNALYFMPLVGLVIGLLVAAIMYLFKGKTSFLQAGMGLLAYYVVTGGIHLDGLSDMADGFLANKGREETLSIMSDSFLGVFGTMALLVYSIIKYTSYLSLLNSLESIIVLSFMTRLSNLYLIKRSRLAKDQGFGKKIKDSIGDKAYLLVILGFLLILASGNLKIISSYIAMILVNELINVICNRKIGGLTGDIYGASIEINEIIGLLILS